MIGCRLIGNPGPVSDEMAACRQLSQQGQSAIERGDWRSAEAYFSQAIEMQPDDATARRHYADALWRRGARQEALLQAEEALQLSNGDPAFAVQVGEMNLSLGRVEVASQLANAALDANPTAAAAWALRSRVAESEGRLDDALADLHRALEYAPGDRHLLWEVAEVQHALGRPHQALAALSALQETYAGGETPPHVWYRTGLALAAIGRHSDAIDAYIAAMNRGGPGADLLAALAEAQFQSGDADAAHVTAQQALALVPGHAAATAIHEQIEGLRTARATHP